MSAGEPIRKESALTQIGGLQATRESPVTFDTPAQPCGTVIPPPVLSKRTAKQLDGIEPTPNTELRSTAFQIFFYRIFEPVGHAPPTRYLALLYDQASAKKSWHTGKTLMGLRESLQGVIGMDWETVEEDLRAVGHHNCVVVGEGYDFRALLIR